LVKKAIPDYKIYIVGCGNLLKLHELTDGDSSVVITGPVESVVPYILKAKICISPLISGAGIRGKQNQYSVLGRPSVTTSIGNKGLIYKNEDSVLVADEPHDFAKAMIRLLTDEELYGAIQKKAKKIAMDNYTWKAHINELESIYRGQ